MTVCVGAICLDGDAPCIIMCSDTRVGVQDFGSSDAGTKFELINLPAPGTLVAMAGSMPCAQELVTRYRQFLGQEPFEKLTALDRFRYPTQRQKTSLVDEYFRSRWSVTREEYLSGILGQLPDVERSRIAHEVEAIGLEASLLLATFVEDEPFLVAVHENGAVLREFDFAIIGSGYAIAFPALCQRRFSRRLPLSKALYLVYEAKRLSEVEPSVGPETEIFLLTKEHPVRRASRDGLKTLARQYKRFGPRKVPESLTLPSGSIIEGPIG